MRPYKANRKKDNDATKIQIITMKLKCLLKRLLGHKVIHAYQSKGTKEICHLLPKVSKLIQRSSESGHPSKSRLEEYPTNGSFVLELWRPLLRFSWSSLKWNKWSKCLKDKGCRGCQMFCPYRISGGMAFISVLLNSNITNRKCVQSWLRVVRGALERLYIHQAWGWALLLT